jgi:hypothetical protein
MLQDVEGREGEEKMTHRTHKFIRTSRFPRKRERALYWMMPAFQNENPFISRNLHKKTHNI